MPNFWKKKKSKKNKSKKKNTSSTPSSSTPSSSTPSVEDEKQKILQEGASGSGVTPAAASSERKDEQNSGSVTTVIPEGAGGLGDVPVSRSTERKDRRKSVSMTTDIPYQPLGATSSRNILTPDHSPEKDYLAVPDEESDSVNQNTPSKRSFSSFLKRAAKKISPNRSSDAECKCENKNKHDLECPERYKLDTSPNKSPNKSPKDKSPNKSPKDKSPNKSPKDKSPNNKSPDKSPNDESPDKSSEVKSPEGESTEMSSISISPVLSKLIEGSQSFSASDPRVKEGTEDTNKFLSELAPEPDHLAVLGEMRDAVNPSSPSKRGLLSRFIKSSSKRVPPNRSSGAECSCEDKNNHDPECSALYKLDTSPNKSPGGISPEVKSPDVKSPEGGSTEISFISISPVPSKGSVEGAKSCIASIPIVIESTDDTLRSELASEKDYLAVPVPEGDNAGPSSPPKEESLLSKIKRKMSPRRNSNSSVRAECSGMDKDAHESDCPAKGKYKKDAKGKYRVGGSATSSSSASPVISNKKKGSDGSNVTSGSSQRSGSKSSSASDPNAIEYLCPAGSSSSPSPNSPKQSAPSGNRKDYDPFEGTSRGSAEHERRHSLAKRWADRLSKYRLKSDGETDKPVEVGKKSSGEEFLFLVDWISLESIEDCSEENRVFTMIRSQSIESVISEACESVMEESVERFIPPHRLLQRARQFWRNQRINLPVAVSQPDNRNVDNEELLRGVGSRPNLNLVRSNSSHILSMCTCRRPAGKKYAYIHELGCPQQIYLRERKKNRRCRKAAEKPKYYYYK